MDIFLEKRNYTKLELLNHLYKAKQGLTLEEMSHYLQLSNISIKRSLTEIEMDLKEFSITTLHIKKKRNVYSLEYPLFNQVSSCIDSLRLAYLKQSVPFNTLQSILQTSYHSIEEVTFSTLISSSYYYKMYKRYKPTLTDLGIDISFSTHPSNIIGVQLNIRNFLYCFFWNSFKDIEWPFTKVKKEFLFNYLVLLDEPTLTRLSPSEEIRVLYHIGIFFEQSIKNKEYIELDSQSEKIMSIFKKIHDISAPITKMATKSSISIPSDSLKNEQIFFNFIVRITSTSIDSNLEKKKIGDNLIYLNTSITHYSSSLITKIVSYFNLECSPVDFSYLMYYTTLYCLNSTIYDIEDYNFFKIHPTKKTKCTAEMKIKTFLTEFHLEYPEKNLTSKMSKHLNMFINFINFIVLYLDTPTLSIFINYSKNPYSELLIKKKLLSFFNQNYLIITDNINSADIIISDCHEGVSPDNSTVYFINDIDEIDSWTSLINYLKIFLIDKHCKI